MDYCYKIYFANNKIIVKSVLNLEEMMRMIHDNDVAWIEVKDLEEKTVIIKVDKIIMVKEI